MDQVAWPAAEDAPPREDETAAPVDVAAALRGMWA
jgi:hypothetical protein